MLLRCLEIPISNPRVLRCRIRSWGHSFFPCPFSLPTPTILRKYSRVWTSAMCYFMRLWMLSPRLHQSTTHLCSLELGDPQKSALDSAWAMLIGVTAVRQTTMPCDLYLKPIWNRCSCFLLHSGQKFEAVAISRALQSRTSQAF